MRHFVLSGVLFTSLATAQTGPGGVGTSATNVLWLRSNTGVENISGAVNQWSDQSGNNNHAFLPGTIPTATPTLVNNSVNGYPSLDLDGTDDQLWVTDHATLDLTQWHFFMVVTVDLLKDYNAWMVKGNDSQENYEMLSYVNGNIHVPTYYTDGTRTIPSSAAGQVNTASFEIIEYSYAAAVGRDVYKNATNIHTDDESKTPQVNNFPLYIGNERSTAGRCVNGDIAEVIAFNARLNSAQRIIANNYLAAKYGRTLGVNDIYLQDNNLNGNYDHDVAGIGRVNASNQQTSSRGSGIVQISGATDLNNGEFLIWGHDNAALDAWGITDYPSPLQGRLARVWRVNEVSTAGAAVDVGNVDIVFDLAGLGTVTASDLRLLVDTDGDGLFADEAPISGATNPSGTLYQFSGVSALQNDRRFTLGTINASSTPLPIELVSFTATAEARGIVRANWVTASEQDNERFTLERSTDLNDWTAVLELPGAGNSTATLSYEAYDREAPRRMVYYRLRQTDYDGTSTVSEAVAVDLGIGWHEEPVVYPNPSTGPVIVILPEGAPAATGFDLIDAMGRSTPVVFNAIGGGSYRLDVGDQPPGTYLLRVLSVAGELAYAVRIQR